MTDVYRLPGPSTTRSALAMAETACGRARGGSGVSHTRRGSRSAAVTALSPLTRPPPSSCACSTTSSRVDGSTRPRTLSTCVDSCTASSKSPVTSVSAAMKRLPKLWPCSPPSSGNRYLKSRLMTDSSSASATRQLRRSPGGGMPMCRRSRPELPPSSAMVTTAVRLLVCALSPRSSAARPLPPPTATTRGPRASLAAARISPTVSGLVCWNSHTRRTPTTSMMAPNSSPSKASRTAAQCRPSSQPMPRPSMRVPDQNTPTAKNAEYTSSSAAGAGEQDPALQPQARVQPLERLRHGLGGDAPWGRPHPASPS